MAEASNSADFTFILLSALLDLGAGTEGEFKGKGDFISLMERWFSEWFGSQLRYRGPLQRP